MREEESQAERLSSAADLRQATTTVGVFEIIEQSAVSTSGRAQGQTAPPLEAAEWASFMDGEGRITDPAGFKARVYESGVSPVCLPVHTVQCLSKLLFSKLNIIFFGYFDAFFFLR